MTSTGGGPVDDRQRAEDNERLRHVAAQELAAMRTELSSALKDRVELHQDLNSLAERLSEQENRTAEVQAELDEALAKLAAPPPTPPPTAPAPSAPARHRWTRFLPKRVRKFAGRALRVARSRS